jgi:hypothetical protein
MAVSLHEELKHHGNAFELKPGKLTPKNSHTKRRVGELTTEKSGGMSSLLS